MSKDLIVVKLDRARALLAQARDATEAKQVADIAHAAKVYAKRQKLSREAILLAHGLETDAKTLLGAFLQAAPKNKGTAGAGPGRGKKGGTKKVRPFPEPPTLADLGISRKDSSEAQQLATLKEKAPDLHEGVRIGNFSVGSARSQYKRRQHKEEAPPSLVHVSECWRVDGPIDCLDWFASRPANSLELVFGSPDYPDGPRLYLENGRDLGIARPIDVWIPWMVDVYRAALRCCTGVVAFVVGSRTKNYRYNAAPEKLTAALAQAGICLRTPLYFRRVGIPGGGATDWLRNDIETIVCATRGGKLPWSDNTAMGHPPKYPPGGAPSHRRRDGSRVNVNGVHGHATMTDCNNDGPHRARQKAGNTYSPPELANPGNVIQVTYTAEEVAALLGGGNVLDCKVGGGRMGDLLAHENEAPFPEQLAEHVIRSFCRPGGAVCDPFCGSGTTLAVALRLGRIAIGCDLRQSQVDLSHQRVARVDAELHPEKVRSPNKIHRKEKTRK
jgi:hypothetical protein